MKQTLIKKSGLVLESLRNNQFRIQLEGGKEIRAYLCGRMVRNKIRILPDDKVVLEIPSFIRISDCVGRIIFRK